MTNPWPTYIRRITGGARGTDIARALGISNSKVSYWMKNERPPSPADAVGLAHAYGRPPLEGLVGAGLLSPEDLDGEIVIAVHAMEQYSDAELAEELLHRARARETRNPKRESPSEKPLGE